MRLLKLFPVLLLMAVLLIGCAEIGTESNPAESVVPEDEIIVRFLVTPEEGGSISGITTQTLKNGEKTTAVEAVPAPGYSFIKWSDGEKTPVHREKKYKEDTDVYAIFDETVDGTPVLYIETEDGKRVRSDTKYVNFTLSVGNIAKKYRVNNVSGQMKTRGNASLGWEKLSYTLAFDQKINLCGIGEGKNRNWVLISNHCDQSLLRNYIAFWLQGHLDGIPWGPSCRLVDLYLNGEYVGNYMLIEKVTTSEEKIDILKCDDTGKLDADFLVELDSYANKAGEKGLVWFTARGYQYEIRGEDNLTKERCDYIDEWMTNAWDIICDGTEEQIREVLDIDAAVDSYILAETTKNIDCGWSSFFLYRKDGKIYLGPSWDFDLAMGNDQRLDNASYKRLYAGRNNGFSQQNHWYLELMELDWFQKLVIARWDELVEDGLFEKMIAKLDAAYEENKESFEHNFERWPIFGQRINQEPNQVRALNSVEEHYNYLRDWLNNRVEWLNQYYHGEVEDVPDETTDPWMGQQGRGRFRR